MNRPAEKEEVEKRICFSSTFQSLMFFISKGRKNVQLAILYSFISNGQVWIKFVSRTNSQR